MGKGTVYKQGRIYWIKYYANGKPYYESSKSTKKMVANKLLGIRIGEIASGKLPGIQFDRIFFNELAEDYLRDYRLNNRKSVERAEISLKHLNAFFENVKVPDITTTRIQVYIERRLSEGAANGTINRELAALKRMLNLGARQSKVDRVPYIPMLQERNIRQGFFESNEYISLFKALPSYLRGPVSFGYVSGWRKSEILGLTWDRVNLEERTVRLEVGETKNDEGRTIYLDDELLKLFKIQWMRKPPDCEHVFHRDGQPIKDFRGAWKKACQGAQIEGRLFHDLRRTGVRNMVRCGIQERVAMKISGHKTRAVFDRYNIVSANDLKEAALKMGRFHDEMVIKTVIIDDSVPDARKGRQGQVIEMAR